MALFFTLVWASYTHAQSTVIYQDDFEGTVSGWSDNSTDYDPDVTNFLGRFAAGQTSTSRTFTMPANTDELVIEFDLYRFDSWDDSAQHGYDRFEVEIDGTEVLSLPFPNPQAARSGASGSVDWSHTPLTGKEELAFSSGQWWFDQFHRFVITVNTPGTTVALTLRAGVSQTKNDESAGYDNFLVTAQTASNDILAVAETFTSIDGDSGGVTPSVLTSDTINGAVLNPSDVTITMGTTSSANVTFDLSTGLITVAANTPAADYTVDYEVCENINLSNCSSVTETITVFVPGGSGGSCPVGTNAVPGTYHVVSVTPINGNPTNPNGALGLPLPETSQDNNSTVSGVTFHQSLIYDLTGDPDISVPAGTAIDVSLANHWYSNPTGNISSSLDGVSYTTPSSSVGPWVNNEFRYDDYIVPSGGARFLQIGYGGGGGLRFDGVVYDAQCHAGSAPITLSAEKTVTVYDPQGVGLYALPDNDVIYTISVENTGTGDVDSGSLTLIDSLPQEVTFYNGDIDDAGPEIDPVTFQDTGGALSFDYNADVSFSNAAIKPTDFTNCTYTPITGYDPDVTYICFNPKGTMTGQSTWSVSFRSRIK